MNGNKKRIGGGRKGSRGKGLIVKEIKWERERWKVGTVYIREKMKKVLERIRAETREKKGERDG